MASRLHQQIDKGRGERMKAKINIDTERDVIEVEFSGPFEVGVVIPRELFQVIELTKLKDMLAYEMAKVVENELRKNLDDTIDYDEGGALDMSKLIFRGKVSVNSNPQGMPDYAIPIRLEPRKGEVTNDGEDEQREQDGDSKHRTRER